MIKHDRIIAICVLAQVQNACMQGELGQYICKNPLGGLLKIRFLLARLWQPKDLSICG
jgi:hypothetical protein